ncbi:MAG: transposase [Bacteroidaceae bacterium]|nr:transposase [Bacteroidaceae bacterium]
MASTLVKVDIHLIFHIKTTSVAVQENDLGRLLSYIGGTIRGLGGIPIEIGGMRDHVHILTSLPKTSSLSDFVRAIKAESSKWLKSLAPMYADFSWQTGYGAFSVSPSMSEKTVAYIRNQKQHHTKRTFQEEYKMFLEAYKVDYDEKYAFAD